MKKELIVLFSLLCSTTLLAQKIDFDRMNEPSFMMVLTAIGDYAFRRSDGVWIVPIAALKQ